MIDPQAALLAGEIHDELIPLLFASRASAEQLVRDLKEAVSEENLSQLRSIEHWLSDAMKISRDLVGDVVKPDFLNASWVQLAKERLGRLHSRYQKVHWNVEPDVLDLPADIAFAAMRVCVEACRNAIDHGQASAVQVTARRYAASFELSVGDDGVGFDASRHYEPCDGKRALDQGHFGIALMQQRAAMLRGDCIIESKIDAGTILTFRVPLDVH